MTVFYQQAYYLENSIKLMFYDTNNFIIRCDNNACQSGK